MVMNTLTVIADLGEGQWLGLWGVFAEMTVQGGYRTRWDLHGSLQTINIRCKHPKTEK